MASALRLLIRVDADQSMGTGHLMRCLVLAEAWRERGGQVLVVTCCQTPSLLQRIEQSGAETMSLTAAEDDMNATCAVITTWRPHYCILDGYHFNSAYQRQLQGMGPKLLVIDDMAQHSEYYADLILNQNIAANTLPYACGPATRLLLGTQYVLLRKEFRRYVGGTRRISDKARKLLVTLGGSDPDNITAKIVKALAALDATWTVKIIVGAANPHYAELATGLRARPQLELLQDVKNMAELMAWADIAISAAGCTVWELLAMGVPSLLVILADNQMANAQRLAQYHAVYSLGWGASLSDTRLRDSLYGLAADDRRRESMHCLGLRLIDGKGADRVLSALQQSAFTLRRAQWGDAALLWCWVNETSVRTFSFQSGLISWVAHKAWLARQLGDKNCMLLLACDAGKQPFAQVRFDINAIYATISISLCLTFRGCGHFAWLINNGIARLKKQYSGVAVIQAFIKPENTASLRSFQRVGFQHHRVVQVRGQVAQEWRLNL